MYASILGAYVLPNNMNDASLCSNFVFKSLYEEIKWLTRMVNLRHLQFWKFSGMQNNESFIWSLFVVQEWRGKYMLIIFYESSVRIFHDKVHSDTLTSVAYERNESSMKKDICVMVLLIRRNKKYELQMVKNVQIYWLQL